MDGVYTRWEKRIDTWFNKELEKINRLFDKNDL